MNIEKEIIEKYLENTCSVSDIIYKFGINKYRFYAILKNNKVPCRESKRFDKKPHSEEFKLNLSKTMKRVHAEGRHPGWCAVNSKKEDSYPEKIFFEHMMLCEELKNLTIIKKHPVGRFVLDFVIVEHKIDIEMDGQYHFNDYKTIEKDKRRNEFLKENGWKVYRISWVYFKKNKENAILELVEFIKSNKCIEHKYTIEDYSPKKEKCVCGNEKHRTSQNCMGCRKKSDLNKRKFEISKEELEKLVKEKPMVEIGKMFGVSDNAVKKRCKILGVELKPMRGYWSSKKIKQS